MHLEWIDETRDKGSLMDGDFDHAIFACHGDQILPMLDASSQLQKNPKRRTSDYTKLTNGSPSPSSNRQSQTVSIEEQDIFNAFQTTENICYLHSDLSLMPTRRDTWSSWNYLITSQPSELKHPAGVSLTYNMNILQHIQERTYGDVFVTMNPGHAPKTELTQGKYIYRHPLYTVDAVRAQERLEGIQNQRGVSYCGAWTKYGFHEDGFSSGLKVAIDHLGAKLPFEFRDSTYSRGLKHELNMMDHLVRMILGMILILIRIVEAFLGLPGVSFFAGVVADLGSLVLDSLERKEILQ